MLLEVAAKDDKKSKIILNAPIRKNSGFTLIELLVVVAIIGVISSVVLVTTNNARNKAKVAKAQADLDSLYKALLMYNADKNSWPPGCNNLDTDNDWNLNGDWKSGYINGKIPRDPWGTVYFFDGCPNAECLPGDSALCSAGPNKAFGSFNRSDMKAVGDDICIYFLPSC